MDRQEAGLSVGARAVGRMWGGPLWSPAMSLLPPGEPSPARERGKKRKKIRCKRATVAPYPLCARLGSHPRSGSERKNEKNTVQMRHSCTISCRQKGDRKGFAVALAPVNLQYTNRRKRYPCIVGATLAVALDGRIGDRSWHRATTSASARHWNS